MDCPRTSHGTKSVNPQLVFNLLGQVEEAVNELPTPIPPRIKGEIKPDGGNLDLQAVN